ncbi:MAG: lipopolysaccharide heptosyltransferase II [Elusimicrobiota bacterium]
MRAIKKICVIRFSSLGDVVLTTAIFPNLKKHWPEAEIHVLTKKAYSSVFLRNSCVDKVIDYDSSVDGFSQLAARIRNEKFDVIIDLHGNLKSWCLRFLAGAPLTVVVQKRTFDRRLLVWFKQISPWLKKSVRERILDCLSILDVPIISTETRLYPKVADQYLHDLAIPEDALLIGLAPGAKHATKRWPVSRFIEAANRLGELPKAIIFVLGDKSDQAVADQLVKHLRVPYRNLAGITNMEDLISVTSKMSLLLTNDSGLMHIAEALNVPLVAMFGPTVRAFGFAPYRINSRVAEVRDLNCRPCTLHGDTVCPLKHHKCMEDIDVNAVLFTASSLLEKTKGVQLPEESSC